MIILRPWVEIKFHQNGTKCSHAQRQRNWKGRQMIMAVLIVTNHPHQLAFPLSKQSSLAEKK